MAETEITNIEESDSRLVAQILGSTSNDNYLSWRFRTIAKMNPYMASNPETLMSMASMPISNQELFSSAGAIFGMQKANELATRLPSYQPSIQRSIFNQLTPTQQNTLRSLGYETPDNDVHSPGFMSDLFGLALTPLRLGAQGLGRLAAPVVGPTLNFAMDVANAPFAAYRTIRQLDTPEQWLALAGGVAGLVTGAALFPVTAGASGTLAAAGIAGLSGLAGATATSFAASTLLNASPNTWINAWNDAWDGERLFTTAATKEAERLLENAQLVALAQEVAMDLDSDLDLYNLAKDIAGVRDGQRQDVQLAQLSKLAEKYGEQGTPEFTEAYQSLKDLFLQPAFKEAVNVLASGKISIGRDVTRLIGSLPGLDLDPSGGVGRWISGGIDAASMFFLDPLLFAGGLANKFKIAKYGLNFEDAGVAYRFREVAKLPKVARKMDLVADAVRTGRVELLDRGAREYRAIYADLRAHFDNLRVLDGPNRAFIGEDVVEYIAGHSQMKSVMSGIGIVHGTNFGVVKGIGASQYYFRRATLPVREFLNGIDDVRIEGLLAKLLDDKEIGPALIDYLHGVSDDVVRELTPIVGDENVARAVARMNMNKPVQELFETTTDNISFRQLFGSSIDDADAVVSRLAADDYNAYRVGRIVGTIPGLRIPLRGAASFIKGVTTAVPGGAITLIGPGAVDDITKFVDLFQGYMPSYTRTAWKQAIINAPEGGIRMVASRALVDSLASSMGLRLSKEGSDLLDDFLYKFDQLYAQGPTGRVTPYFDSNVQFAAGAQPIGHMAEMLPIPNLDEIRKAVRQGKIFEFLIGKNPHILALQNKYWKPAVLLRLGFIFRNVGEEMLGFITRYGFGSLMQEFTARGLAQRNLYAKVRTATLNLESVDMATQGVQTVLPSARKTITEVDRWIQRSRWDLPAAARPVARVVDRMGKSSRPYVMVMSRYGEWLQDLLVRRLNQTRAQLHAGYGSAYGLRRFTEPIEGTERALIDGVFNADTAKKNLQNWWRQLAFGNERSLRRMVIGGVDPKLVKHAEQFEGVFLKQIMEQVGTSNMAPWQRLRHGKNLVNASVVTPRGEEIVLVQDLGIREYATMDNPSMLSQPHSAAVQQIRQGMLDDPIIAAGINEFGLILNPEIAASLPPETLKQVLLTFDSLLTQVDDKLDSEFFQLYLTLSSSRFDRNRFDAILANMKRQASKVVEQFPQSTIYRRWAESRNELVDSLRRAFPAGKQPTWDEIAAIIADPEKNPMLEASWVRYRDIPYLSADDPDQFLMGKGYAKIARQTDAFTAINNLLGPNVSYDAREWINRLLMSYYDQPTLFDMQMVRQWNPANGFADSPFYGSFKEAEPAIRERMRAEYQKAVASKPLRDRLNLNARWASAVESAPLYVVEPQIITDELDRLDPLWRISSLTQNNPMFARLAQVLPAGPENLDEIQRLHEQIRFMLANNRPLIFANQESAEEILRLFIQSVPTNSVKRAFVTKPSSLTGPVTADEAASLFARQLGLDENVAKFERLTPLSETAEGIDDFGLLTYQADDISDQALASFHYENITEQTADARLDSILDSAVDYIRQNVLAGRRAQFYARNDDAARPVYRVSGGVPEQVEPGEIISTNEIFYSSPDASPDSIVKMGDQRYFFSDFPKYEGNDEILWSIMNPIMFDHAEGNLGLAIYQAKSPLLPSGGVSDFSEADYIRLRHASVDDVKRTNQNALPDYEIVQVYRPVVENVWDRIVQYGFGRVIGPWIDALARKPIAFHAFALAADRNTANLQWLIRNSPRQANLRMLSDQLIKDGVLGGPSGQFIDMYGELGRLIGRAHEDINANTWSNLEAIAYLRGSVADDPDLLLDLVESWSVKGSAYEVQTSKLSTVQNNTLMAAANDLRSNLGRLDVTLTEGTTDEFLALIDRTFGPNSGVTGRAAGFEEVASQLPISMMTEEQAALDGALRRTYPVGNGLNKTGWEIVQDAATQRKAVEQDVYKYAAEHAIRDLMPFIDTHEIRSQFADSVSGLLPFWYAEENFLKRWAKMFAEGGPALTLARIRKLQMTYLGLRTMGIIRQDPQGRDYFVWPGSEYMNEVLQRVFGTELPLNTVFQSPTERIVPGFQPAFGAPQTGPFVSVPLDAVASIFPETVPLERAIVGDFGMFRSVLEHIIPAQIRNTWEAVAAFSNQNLNGSNERHAAAMMTAMQQLEFTPYALRDDATAGEKDEYLRRVRDHARVILLSQALGGWFMPAQLSPLTTPNASSLSWITSGGIENPVELLSAEYYELISNLGIEEGTIAFLELNADANLNSVVTPLAATVVRSTTPSGAPLPTTEEGIMFYLDNQELLDQHPEAGPWLLPQDATRQSKRSQYAYDTEIVSGLRQRRTPEEFLDALKYKEGAAIYFDSRKRFETEHARLKASGDTTNARKLSLAWDNWSTTWRVTHPIFAEGLVSSDTRQRRYRILDQMRYLLKDPMAPRASHFEAMKTLMDTFDAFMIARGYLALDRTAAGQSKLAAVKVNFGVWAEEFTRENPEVLSFYQTVISPEAGID